MSAPEVRAAVKVVPAKRRATYTVPLSEAKADVLTADVQARTITFRTNGGYSISLDKTHAHLDALDALLKAVRAELVEQGVES